MGWGVLRRRSREEPHGVATAMNGRRSWDVRVPGRIRIGTITPLTDLRVQSVSAVIHTPHRWHHCHMNG